MIVFKVEEPVFKTEPLFIFGCSFEKLSIYLKRHYRWDPGDDVGQCGQMFTLKKAPWRIVWVEKFDQYVLLHELYHLVSRICQDKGIPIIAQMEHGNGDEAGAYLFEFFARRTLRRIQR